MTNRRAENHILTETAQPFRPRARMLQLLGDELIGSARLAVFELVKNAYDADATEAIVCLEVLSEPEAAITVTDDGEGMTFEVIKSIWLVPGDDHRQRQRLSKRRTRKYGRLPLGEKGLGRFAVHKLGNHIELVTRAAGANECIVAIDWDELIAYPYLDQAPVTITVRRPEVFLGDRTGTRIQIRQLRESTWSRREVRRLHNQITSICSPFEEPSGFRAVLRVPGLDSWIEDLPDVTRIVDQAPWKFSFRADGKTFDWMYEFRRVPGFKLDGRTVRKCGDQLQLPAQLTGESKQRKKVIADASVFEGIGPVTGEFYVYDRDREVRKNVPNIRALENYLDETGGVRVYRDGIRVYNYGESGDDWLGLDLRRVNVPTRKISRNIVLGAIHLSLEGSTGLVEKTNREGFVENRNCEQLRRIAIGVLTALEAERKIDKERIRQLSDTPTDPLTTRLEKPIQALKWQLKKDGLLDRFEPYLDKLAADYRTLQETLLSAGMSGLNLAVVFHEIERGVRELYNIISKKMSTEAAVRHARDLMHVLDGFSALLRKDSRKTHTGSRLINAAQRNAGPRFRHHRIRFVCPPLEEKDSSDFHSDFAFNLVLGALSNLIDNSIYWLRVRWIDDSLGSGDVERKIYCGISRALDAGPAIIVADNGVGLEGDDPEFLVRPFFTRKPEGMGLGLYYASVAMELNGGHLVFPSANEVDIPGEFDGAVVALVFKEST